MGIYGKPYYIPVKKFKIFFYITQYIVPEINYFHTYGYLFEKSVDQKNNEFFTEK